VSGTAVANPVVGRGSGARGRSALAGSPGSKPVPGSSDDFLGGTLETFEAAKVEGSEAPARKSTKGLLYSGDAVDRWFGRLVVDLATMKVPKGAMPHLFQHGFTDKPELGVVKKVDVSGGKLAIEGYLLDNETAERVASNSKGGFPYQMSMGIDYGPKQEDMQFIPSGSTLKANGRTFDGPVYFARNTILREASTVLVGADGATSQTIMRHEPRGADSMSELLAGLTIETLRAERPELVVQIQKGSPATVEQLEALPGADASFVLGQFKNQATLATATHALLAAANEKLAGIEKAHAEKVAGLEKTHTETLAAVNAECERLGVQNAAAMKAAGLESAIKKPGTPAANGSKLSGTAAGGDTGAGDKFAGCAGLDPEADWKASEELRAKFNNSKGAFDTFVRQCEAHGASHATKW
jgi:hypothetical protein